MVYARDLKSLAARHVGSTPTSGTKNMKNQKVVPIIFDSYIALIKNSLGSKLFRNFYAKVDGKETDIMRNGELSCAFHASSILALSKLIHSVHGTVISTVKDLKENGWKEIKKPEIGSVLIWEIFDSASNKIQRHIGFFIGNNKAISNDSKLGYPIEHPWKAKGKLEIQNILWNSRIKSKSFKGVKKS